MAAANSTRARGVQVSEFPWGIIYRGRRDMLIQHGHAQDGRWPGDPGAKKTREHSTDPQGRAIEIRRASKLIFEVWRDWSEAEKLAQDRREEQRKEVEYAARKVDGWPKSGNAFREKARPLVELNIQLLDAILRDGQQFGGYRFDDAALLRLEVLCDQLLDLVDTGGIVKDLALRAQATPACVAKTVRAADAAKQDRSFQSFLAGLAK